MNSFLASNDFETVVEFIQHEHDILDLGFIRILLRNPCLKFDGLDKWDIRVSGYTKGGV